VVDFNKDELITIWPFNLINEINPDIVSKVSLDGIARGFEYLTTRESNIVILRFRDKKTLQEIADIAGISKERVRQICDHVRKVLNQSEVIKEITTVSVLEYDDLRFKNADLQRTLSTYENQIKDKYGPKEYTDEEFQEVVENITLEECRLSVRLFNCLKRRGINRLIEVAILDEEEILKIRNLGRRCYEELLEVLDKYHLTLNLYGNSNDELYRYGIRSNAGRVNCYKLGINTIQDLTMYTPDELVSMNIIKGYDAFKFLYDNLSRHRLSLAENNDLANTDLVYDVIHALKQIGINDIKELKKYNYELIESGFRIVFGSANSEYYANLVCKMMYDRGTPIKDDPNMDIHAKDIRLEINK